MKDPTTIQTLRNMIAEHTEHGCIGKAAFEVTLDKADYIHLKVGGLLVWISHDKWRVSINDVLMGVAEKDRVRALPLARMIVNFIE